MALEILSIPLDPKGFFRRQCPDCRREFKLRWTELDGSLILRHLGTAIPFANGDEVAQDSPLICPYCAHREQAVSFFTAAQMAHLTKRAESLVAEIRFEQLRHVERSLADNPYPARALPRHPRAGSGRHAGDPPPLLLGGDQSGGGLGRLPLLPLLCLLRGALIVGPGLLAQPGAPIHLQRQ